MSCRLRSCSLFLSFSLRHASEAFSQPRCKQHLAKPCLDTRQATMHAAKPAHCQLPDARPGVVAGAPVSLARGAAPGAARRAHAAIPPAQCAARPLTTSPACREDPPHDPVHVLTGHFSTPFLAWTGALHAKGSTDLSAATDGACLVAVGACSGARAPTISPSSTLVIVARVFAPSSDLPAAAQTLSRVGPGRKSAPVQAEPAHLQQERIVAADYGASSLISARITSHTAAG